MLRLDLPHQVGLPLVAIEACCQVASITSAVDKCRYFTCGQTNPVCANRLLTYCKELSQCKDMFIRSLGVDDIVIGVSV